MSEIFPFGTYLHSIRIYRAIVFTLWRGLVLTFVPLIKNHIKQFTFFHLIRALI